MDFMRSLRKFLRSKSMSLIYVTAVVFIIFYLINGNYLTRDNFRGIMNTMGVTGIIAVGIAFLLMGGGINLGAGAEGCFGAILVALSMQAGVPWPLALLIGLLFGMCAGLINSFFINVLNFPGFITTLALASMYGGVGLVITNGANIGINAMPFLSIGTGALFNFIPIPFVIMACITIIYGIILNKTRFGRSILMCGGNRAAARLAGLNPKKINTILYMNSGMLSALAGCVLAARMHFASPSALGSSTLDAITAAVLGGVSFLGGGGSISGIFLGIFLLTSFNNGLVVIDLDAYWQLVSQGAVLIIALGVDFFSTKARATAIKKASVKKAV